MSRYSVGQAGFKTQTGLLLDSPDTARVSTATGVPSPVLNTHYSNDTTVAFADLPQSIRVDIEAADNDRITLTIPLAAAVDITGYETLNFAFYMPDQQTVTEYKKTTNTGLETILYISDDTGATSETIANNVFAQHIGEGWCLLTFDLSDFSGGALDKTSIDWFRFTFSNENDDGEGRTIYYGGLFAGYRQRAKLVISFDDGYDDHFAEAYGYMNPLGLKGACLINSDSIDTATYMTSANLRTLDAAGWDLLNHGSNHDGMVTGAATYEADVITGKNFLAGITSQASNIFGVAGGQYTNEGTQILKQQGYQYIRGINSGYCNFSQGLVSRYNFPSKILQNTDTFTGTAKPYLDDLISKGVCGSLYIHKLEASGGSNSFAIAEFQATIDYIYQLKQRGQVDVVTFSELFELEDTRTPITRTYTP